MNENLTQFSGSYGTSAQTSNMADGHNKSRKLLLLATVVSLALWYVPYSNYLLYPLRLFVTFIHESGHALAATIAGQSVSSLTVHPDGSGVTWTTQNRAWDWLVISGGYLGTAVFGALMLQVVRLTERRNIGRAALYAIAFTIFAITVLWAHNPLNNLFTLVVGLALSAAFWAIARFTAPQVANFVAGFLAVQCSLNALGDLRILFDLNTKYGGENDAVFMAQAYGMTPVLWTLLWAMMALAALLLSLRSYWVSSGARPTRPKLPR